MLSLYNVTYIHDFRRICCDIFSSQDCQKLTREVSPAWPPDYELNKGNSREANVDMGDAEHRENNLTQ